MAPGGYVITRRRRLLSLLVGAGTGGSFAFISFLLSPGARASLLANPPVVLVAALTWLIFSLLFLVPIIPIALFWAWAGRRRSLGWKTAAAWGGLLGAFCSAAPFVALLTKVVRKIGFSPSFSIRDLSFSPHLIWFAVACPVIGCVVALATWRFAYRRQSASAVGEVFS